MFLIVIFHYDNFYGLHHASEVSMKKDTHPSPTHAPTHSTPQNTHTHPWADPAGVEGGGPNLWENIERRVSAAFRACADRGILRGDVSPWKAEEKSNL